MIYKFINKWYTCYNVSVGDEMKDKIIGFLILIFFCVFIVIFCFFSSFLIETFGLYDICLKINVFILLFLPFYYLINYFIEKIRLKKIENKLVMKKLDIQYFRDIINNYSPGVLSLIYDGRLVFDKDLMLSILYLQNKGYIKIENNIIKLINNKFDNLNNNLKIILENYDLFLDDTLSTTVNGKVIKTKTGLFHRNWSESIFNEAVAQGLVVERKEKKVVIGYFLSIFLFIEGVLFFCGSYGEMAIFAFFLSFFSYILKYLSFAWNQYPKTKKGYELYAKIKGLKNFINDFSILTEKEVKELEVWDDYILYAIMFNKNSHLNKDVKFLYKSLKDEANKYKFNKK